MIIVIVSVLIYLNILFGVCDVSSIIVVSVDGLVSVGIVSGMMNGLLFVCGLLLSVLFGCGKIICSVIRNSMILLLSCSDRLVRFIICRKWLLIIMKNSRIMNVIFILCRISFMCCLCGIFCIVEMNSGMLLSGFVISMRSMVVDRNVYFIVFFGCCV